MISLKLKVYSLMSEILNDLVNEISNWTCTLLTIKRYRVLLLISFTSEFGIKGSREERKSVCSALSEKWKEKNISF